MAILAFTLFALVAPASVPVSGADGTTGTVDLDMTSVSEDTIIWVHIEGLTSSADYLVNWTDDNTGYSYTTGSSQTDYYVQIKFAMPSSGTAFTVYLRYQSAGTLIDSVQVRITDPATILDEDAFLTIAIPIIVITVIVSIVVGLTVKKKFGRWYPKQ